MNASPFSLLWLHIYNYAPVKKHGPREHVVFDLSSLFLKQYQN